MQVIKKEKFGCQIRNSLYKHSSPHKDSAAIVVDDASSSSKAVSKNFAPSENSR
jgi:hypothetical protein